MRWACALPLLGGCLTGHGFVCELPGECGAVGVCEDTGYCSFPDPECAGGRRYGEYAGALSDACVGAVVLTPDGGVGGSCGTRYTVHGDMRSWDDAEATCEASGAHLMVADDTSEESFFGSLGLGQGAWIGLTDRRDDGTFAWVTGAPVTLELWDAGEPRADVGDCVLALLDRWQVRPCSEPHGFFCECDDVPVDPASR